MKKPLVLISTLIIFILSGCNIVPVKYDDTMLDGPAINDTSLADPTFRVSSHPDRATFDRTRPVIICVHGYGACTYEWEEFRDYVTNNDIPVYTSLVLLGGHGRDIEDLIATTWKDWEKPVMDEYDSLVKMGFTNISFAASSAGGAILVEYLSRNAFSSKPIKPKNVFFIDAMVISSNKLMTAINVLGPVLGNSPMEMNNPLAKAHWYTNRPASTLRQLQDLCELCRQKLEKGFRLPEGTYAKIYKSEHDDSVDPISALMMYKGMFKSDGNRLDVQMVQSDLHVFTRLHARGYVSHADSVLQQATFKDIVDKSTN
jgi:carboxylesterase